MADAWTKTSLRPSGGCPSLNQPISSAATRMAYRGFDAELVVDRAQVRIHRAAADDEPLGDLWVAQVVGETGGALRFRARQRCAGSGGWHSLIRRGPLG